LRRAFSGKYFLVVPRQLSDRTAVNCSAIESKENPDERCCSIPTTTIVRQLAIIWKELFASALKSVGKDRS